MPAPARPRLASCGLKMPDASGAGPETVGVQDVESWLVSWATNCLHQLFHERVMVSCRFKMTRAILVHTANSAGSASGGGDDWPILSSACAAAVLQRYSASCLSSSGWMALISSGRVARERT